MELNFVQYVDRPRRGIAAWPGPVAVISIAQLLGTSLWFSANGVVPGLMREWHVSVSDIGWLTSSTQIGFILGTLLISITGFADRVKASQMFVGAAIAGAVFNACFAWLSFGLVDAALYRLAVGLCLAGIYPIGMKLIVTWVRARPGWALSLLVSMLTLGTALPHALAWGAPLVNWRAVATTSSLLALLGAGLIHTLGDGPYSSGVGTSRIAIGGWARLVAVFSVPDFRAAAFGYFGHMWELYAFWTLLPMVLASTDRATSDRHVSSMAFVIIAAGSLGCVLGGALSRRVGSARVATAALALSGLCGSAFLLGIHHLSHSLLVLLLVGWGASVIADSPHFSALSARACDPSTVGTALAIQNSIGFGITVISISAVTTLFEHFGIRAAWLLVAGPVVGLYFISPLARRSPR